jgi:hypothetical protein
MPISLQHHLPFAAMLACAAVACSERPSPVAPIATALAANNGGAPQPVDSTPYTDPNLSAICGFPVQVALEGKSKQLVLPGGRIFSVSPGFTMTLTNLTSGSTEHLVATGTAQITTLPNGNLEIVMTGRNVVAFDNSFVHPFANSLIFITGRYSLVIDPATGAIVEPLHGNGQIIDICDLLASPN